MNKPTHAFAAFVWVITAAVAVTAVVLYFVPTAQFRSQPDSLFWAGVLRSIFLLTEFAAAGVVVELLDRLCWLATPEQERAALARTYLLSRWRRSRVS